MTEGVKSVKSRDVRRRARPLALPITVELERLAFRITQSAASIRGLSDSKSTLPRTLRTSVRGSRCAGACAISCDTSHILNRRKPGSFKQFPRQARHSSCRFQLSYMMPSSTHNHVFMFISSRSHLRAPVLCTVFTPTTRSQLPVNATLLLRYIPIVSIAPDFR
jgi:hypothetical protein